MTIRIPQTLEKNESSSVYDLLLGKHTMQTQFKRLIERNHALLVRQGGRAIGWTTKNRYSPGWHPDYTTSWSYFFNGNGKHAHEIGTIDKIFTLRSSKRFEHRNYKVFALLTNCEIEMDLISRDSNGLYRKIASVVTLQETSTNTDGVWNDEYLELSNYSDAFEGGSTSNDKRIFKAIFRARPSNTSLVSFVHALYLAEV